MSYIARLHTKTPSGATHTRFIYRISESLRDSTFNPKELELLWEFKYASMLFYRASCECGGLVFNLHPHPLTLIYTVMWLENFRLVENSRKNCLENNGVGICLGKTKKQFISVLQQEFYNSTSNTNFPPLTLEKYNKTLSLINGTTPYGKPLFTLDEFYPDKKYIHNNFITVSLKSIIWVHERAVIKDKFTQSTSGRLTGYNQRFNFIQQGKWKELGLDVHNNKNFLRDLISFKSGLMPSQEEEMKKITDKAREYLKKYLPSHNCNDDYFLRKKRENQRNNRVCYGVRQRARTPNETTIRNVNTVLSQSRNSLSAPINMVLRSGRQLYRDD